MRIGSSLSEEGAAPTLYPEPLVRLLGRYEHDQASGKVDLYPASRHLEDRPAGRPRATTVAQEKLTRLSFDGRRFGSLWGFFQAEVMSAALGQEETLRREGAIFADAAAAPHERLRRALSTLIDDPRLVGADAAGDLVFQDAKGRRVTSAALPDGARQALLLAGSFLRLAHRGSVVLIDGIELHLHPGRHVPMLRGLADLGNQSQIIATTTSAELVSSRVADLVVEL